MVPQLVPRPGSPMPVLVVIGFISRLDTITQCHVTFNFHPICSSDLDLYVPNGHDTLDLTRAKEILLVQKHLNNCDCVKITFEVLMIFFFLTSGLVPEHRHFINPYSVTFSTANGHFKDYQYIEPFVGFVFIFQNKEYGSP